MTYTYTIRDGERVEVHVAGAFDRMERAFTNRFGLGLVVASGTRTNAEQWKLWNAYQQGGTLAAYPGTSNHEENGPTGPRALDIWDTGSDPGVTTYGTPRAEWLRAHAHEYGFNPAGYTFRRNGIPRIEPWHYEYTGSLTTPIDKTTAEDEETMILNIKGKKGKRRGGLYLVIGHNARFIGYHKKSSYPLWTNEAEIARLQKSIKGLK